MILSKRKKERELREREKDRIKEGIMKGTKEEEWMIFSPEERRKKNI